MYGVLYLCYWDASGLRSNLFLKTQSPDEGSHQMLEEGCRSRASVGSPVSDMGFVHLLQSSHGQHLLSRWLIWSCDLDLHQWQVWVSVYLPLSNLLWHVHLAPQSTEMPVGWPFAKQFFLAESRAIAETREGLPRRGSFGFHLSSAFAKAW